MKPGFKGIRSDCLIGEGFMNELWYLTHELVIDEEM
jgi:hypothetical protein